MTAESIYRQVAKLHIDALNKGFLATLGVGMLALLYRAIDESPKSKLIVKQNEGEVIGFVSGTTSMMTVYLWLFRYPIRLLVEIFWLIFRPKAVWRILELLIYGSKQKVNISGNTPPAELLSIAISQKFRGQGFAEELYIMLAQSLQQDFIIVVGESLVRAQRFYRKMGAKKIDEICVHGSEKSIVLLQHVRELLL